MMLEGRKRRAPFAALFPSVPEGKPSAETQNRRAQGEKNKFLIFSAVLRLCVGFYSFQED
jgi:hypothetical protein